MFYSLSCVQKNVETIKATEKALFTVERGKHSYQSKFIILFHLFMFFLSKKHANYIEQDKAVELPLGLLKQKAFPTSFHLYYP